MKNKVLIIDGHSLAYRSYYAMPLTLTLENKQPINAVYGFISMLFLALEKYQPKYLCVCFDRKEPTFRHEMYQEYKAHRPPSPEEFRTQVPLLKHLLNDLKIATLEKATFEADDLIGSLAQLSKKQDIECLIMTGDSDALQLVDENTIVLMNSKGVSEIIEYTVDKVQEKYNLTPPQLLDMKALKGDSSDNIPGVEGIGQKTATDLINTYQSVQNIYDNLDKINKESVKNKLLAGREKAFLSYALVQINCAVDLGVNFIDIEYHPDWKKILKAFEEFNFTSLRQKYGRKLTEEIEFAHKENKEETSYQILSDIKRIKAVLADLKSGFAIDLETTSKNAIEAQIVGVAIASKEKQAFYIPLNKYVQKVNIFDGQTSLFQSNEDKAKLFKSNPVLDIFKPILENPEIAKYTHNGKYEYIVFKNYGITLAGMQFDSMIAAYLLYPGQRLGLKELVKRTFKQQMQTYAEVTKQNKQELNFSEVAIEEACNYACADADFTLRLKRILEPELKSNGLEKLFSEIEMPLQIVLAKMEFAGVTIDIDYLNTLSKDYEKRLLVLEKEIYAQAKEVFNINSTKQLAEILFHKLGIPVVKKTKTGLSTNSYVLEKIKNDYPIAQLILAYRSLEKLLNTYINKLPFLINQETNKIHASFNQTITITGRLSSSRPNLQNIPIKTVDGAQIRKAFVPANKTNYILSADYSQVELRLLAHLSQDENMIAAFKNDLDIHSATAASVFNVDLEEVSKEQRSKAKAVNFGISYGMSAFGLAEALNISRKEAQAIINSYFTNFPKVKTYINQVIAEATAQEYVTTEFGRKRPIIGASTNKFAQRTAINTCVQGTAADIMKIAMINIQKKMEEKNLASQMIIQVHDELVFDIIEKEKDLMLELVKSEMENAAKLDVPLTVNVIIGKNWQEIS
jgi:DNA polymerase-1